MQFVTCLKHGGIRHQQPIYFFILKTRIGFRFLVTTSSVLSTQWQITHRSYSFIFSLSHSVKLSFKNKLNLCTGLKFLTIFKVILLIIFDVKISSTVSNSVSNVVLS